MKINEKLKSILLEKGLTDKIIEEIENKSNRKSNIESLKEFSLDDDISQLKDCIEKINKKIKNSNFVFGYYCKKKQ